MLVNSKCKYFILTFILSFIFAKNSYALINAELLIGPGSAKTKLHKGDSERELSGYNLKGAIFVDPIPVVPVPVAVGLGFDVPAVKKDEAQLGGIAIDLQIKAWSPVGLFGFTPYAKVAYTFFGRYASKFDYTQDAITVPGMTQGYENNGSTLAIGTHFSVPIPLVELMFEVSYSTQTFKAIAPEFTKTNVSAVDDDIAAFKDAELNYSMTSFLFGIRAGI